MAFIGQVRYNFDYPSQQELRSSVAVGKPEEIVPDTLVHRVGGGSVDNLRLSPLEEALTPPGISVLLGGTPQEAADQMRRAFPRSRKWQEASRSVGTATTGAVRQTGFDVVPDATARFANHARVIHPDGVDGFNDGNLDRLAQTFENTTEDTTEDTTEHTIEHTTEHTTV